MATLQSALQQRAGGLLHIVFKYPAHGRHPFACAGCAPRRPRSRKDSIGRHRVEPLAPGWYAPAAIVRKLSAERDVRTARSFTSFAKMEFPRWPSLEAGLVPPRLGCTMVRSAPHDRRGCSQVTAGQRFLIGHTSRGRNPSVRSTIHMRREFLIVYCGRSAPSANPDRKTRNRHERLVELPSKKGKIAVASGRRSTDRVALASGIVSFRYKGALWSKVLDRVREALMSIEATAQRHPSGAPFQAQARY